MINRTKVIMNKRVETEPTYSRRQLKTEVSEQQFYEARKVYDHLKQQIS